MSKQYFSNEFNRRWFISHRGVDTNLAKWIDKQFQEIGQQTVLDAYDFLPGQSFLTRMEEASESTDHTICLMTEDFLSSPYCRQEFEDAFAADPSDKKKRLVIVMAGNMKDSDLPTCVSDRIYIDLRGGTQQEQKIEFQSKIKSILQQTQRPNPDLQHKVLVMFARFREISNDVKSNPGTRWPVIFQYKLQDLMKSEDAAIIEISDEIQDEVHAQRLMKSSGAQIVVWGVVDDDLLGVQYSFNSELGFTGLPPQLLQTSEFVDIGNGLIKPEMLKLYLRKGGDTEYHLSLLLGLFKFHESLYEESLSFLDRCVDLFPFETLQHSSKNELLCGLFLFRSWVKYNSGNLKDAIEEHNKAISLVSSTCPYLFVARGSIQASLSNFSEAINDFDTAIGLGLSDPESLVFLYGNRGFVKAYLGDFHGALSDYNKAIILKDDIAFVYSNRGRVKQDLGDVSGAKADYDRSISLDANHVYAYFHRGYLKYTQGDFQGALDDYNMAINLGLQNLDEASVYYHRSNAKGRLGDFQGALDDINKSIELNTKIANRYKYRSDLYKVLGDKVRSRNDDSTYRRLIKLDKNKQ